MNIELKYRRVQQGYTGMLEGTEFTGLSFADMMMLVRDKLLAFPGCGLLILRTERPGLFPVHLEPSLLKQLIEEPAKYIAANSIPDRTVDIQGTGRISKLAEPYHVPRGGLRNGHDTLAEAFGDFIYLRLRDSKVEHPCTGRWEPVSKVQAALGIAARRVYPTDEGKGFGWLIVCTLDLLKVDTIRFYLPREWNKGGPWISKTLLQAAYEKFRKELSQCQ